MSASSSTTYSHDNSEIGNTSIICEGQENRPAGSMQGCVELLKIAS